MKRAWIFLVVGLAASGCATAPAPKPFSIRVLTYNVRPDDASDTPVDTGRIADLIAKAHPDLVALQGIDVHTRRSGVVDEVELINPAPRTSFFAATRTYERGRHGLAVLVGPMAFGQNVGFRNHPLPHAEGAEPRAAAEVRMNGHKPFRLVNTRLDGAADRASRLRQADRLVELFGAEEWPPMILAGDLGSAAGSEELSRLSEAFLDVGPAPEEPSRASAAPARRRGHVLIRKDDPWVIESVELMEGPGGSNYAPLLVELRYEPGLNTPGATRGERVP